MGAAAAMGAAAVWAISVVLMASQASKMDFLSVSTLRLVAASLFFAVILLPLGADADLGRMSVGDIGQLVGTGVLNLAVGDTLYIGAIVLLGVSFAYTLSLALFALFSFALSVVFLDESVGWETAVGSVLVLTGVYVVSLYGRDRSAGGATEDTAQHATEGAAQESVSRPGLTAAAPAGSASASSPALPPQTPSRTDQPIAVALAGSPATTLQEPGSGAPVTVIAEMLRRWLPGRMPGGLLLIVLAALAWAGGTVWLRDAADGFEATAVGVVRIPSAMITLAAIAYLSPRSSLRRRTIPRDSHGPLALAGITGAGVGSLLFIFAVQEIGAGQTAVLSSLSPLFALPLAAIFLGERITVWLLVGVVLAVAGIVLLSA